MVAAAAAADQLRIVAHLAALSADATDAVTDAAMDASMVCDDVVVVVVFVVHDVGLVAAVQHLPDDSLWIVVVVVAASAAMVVRRRRDEHHLEQMVMRPMDAESVLAAVESVIDVAYLK